MSNGIHRHPVWRTPYPGSQSVGACLMAKPPSSDIQVSFSFAKTSKHLIPFSLKLPSISYPWTSNCSTLVSSNLFPQKHFHPNKCHLKILALTIPSYPDTQLLPPFCPQLPSFSSCTQLNPSFCLGSPWREKACVWKDALKILPDTHSIYSEGEKRNPNNRKCISDTDKEFFLFLPGYRLMEQYNVITSSYHVKKTQDNIFQMCSVIL